MAEVDHQAFSVDGSDDANAQHLELSPTRERVSSFWQPKSQSGRDVPNGVSSPTELLDSDGSVMQEETASFSNGSRIEIKPHALSFLGDILAGKKSTGADTSAQLFARARFFLTEGLHGRNPMFNEDHTEETLWAHHMLHKLYPLSTLSIVAYMLVPFFEQPSWCFNSSCGDPDDLLMSQLPKFHPYASLSIELVCFLFFFVYNVLLFFRAHGLPRTWAWSPVFRCLCILLGFTDVVISFLVPSKYRIASFLRPFLLVSIRETVLRRMTGLLKVIPQVFPVIYILIVLLFSFSWAGMLLWHGTEEGDVWFPSFFDSATHLLILLTTANSPDIMIPAYTEDRASAIFFIVFLAVGLYVLYNMLLASFFACSKAELRNEYKGFKRNREQALRNCFQVLQRHQQGGGVSAELMTQFLNTLRNLSNREQLIVIGVNSSVADASSGAIDMIGFRAIVTHMQFGPQTTEQPDTWRDRLYNRHSWFRSLRAAALSNTWEQCNDVFVLVHIALMGTQTNQFLDGNFKHLHLWESLNALFCAVYLLEMGVKLVVFGWRGWCEKYGNVIDATFNMCMITSLVLVSYYDGVNNQSAIIFSMALRTPCPVRLLTGKERLRTVLDTILHLRPIINLLWPLVVFNYYLFAAIGMTIFGGLIYKSNPGLNGTTFAASGFYPNNFNDFPSSMVLLFDLMVVNNWFVHMDGFTAVTNVYARIFFMLWFFAMVVVVLNIFVALVIEIFVRTYTRTNKTSRKSLKQQRRSQGKPALESLFGSESIFRLSMGNSEVPTPPQDPAMRRFAKAHGRSSL
eukprot:GILJ01008124.1.p1 GENE.GILJ01008124.1~~GILJ01008124.1.p1  ORF type:complete len:797 (-),score=94.64 GILJ01008124.1:278-2668(-)